ncbi:MAG: response regulator [Rickettsiales bacterium]
MTDAAKKQSPARILVVEDTESHVLLAKGVLEKFGITPFTANNYEEAIAVFRQQPLDLILMDLQMPAKSGYEITYEIRRIEHEGQKPRTPIVAVTAFMMDDAYEKCLKAGMDDCVAKPLSVPLCEDMFARFLSEKKLKLKSQA